MTKSKEVMTAAEAREYFASGGKAKAKITRKKSAADIQLEQAEQEHRIKKLQQATGQQVIAEHAFHPERKWRIDFFLPESNIAIEVEGGVWTQGRHTRGKGYVNDLEKYNAAQAMGIMVLRFTPEQLLKPKALKTINQTIQFKET
ncbi:hypothetical protein [Pontibacter sp. H249]|uniref:hypothetical protein n=1 Tax=Pontibacter sp. H249 TaxID=3133420 RepID=UPI0030BA3E79